MRIAITGHRPNKLWNDYELTSLPMRKIRSASLDLLELYPADELISGMALGIDTLWAELALDHGYRLIAVIPDTAQPDRWPLKSQTRYYRILDKAGLVVNVSRSSVYKTEHMQLRNKWMVDYCDLLIAVWDGLPGGTANCVKYAESVNCKL